MNLVYDDKPRPLDVVLADYAGTPKITKQNLTVRVCKSEAKVTNNNRLRSRCCTVEANLRHEASRGLSARAALVVVGIIICAYKTVRDVGNGTRRPS